MTASTSTSNEKHGGNQVMDVPTNLVDASANDYLISRKWLEGFLQRYTEHVPNKSRPVIGIEDVILRQPQVHWDVVHVSSHVWQRPAAQTFKRVLAFLSLFEVATMCKLVPQIFFV